MTTLGLKAKIVFVSAFSGAIILGIVLYAGSLLFGLMGRRLTLSENPHAIITLVSTGGVYALYGVLNEWLLIAVWLGNNPNRDLL